MNHVDATRIAAIGYCSVDYRLIRYPGAVHSFTVPQAGSDPSSGMAYNAQADAQSWQELVDFLRSIF
jgi:dienelactone hydrolase